MLPMSLTSSTLAVGPVAVCVSGGATLRPLKLDSCGPEMLFVLVNVLVVAGGGATALVELGAEDDVGRGEGVPMVTTLGAPPPEGLAERVLRGSARVALADFGGLPSFAGEATRGLSGWT